MKHTTFSVDLALLDRELRSVVLIDARHEALTAL